jgi:hypothetical protein
MNSDLVDTPYGSVNRSVLEGLKNDFSSLAVLHMVEEFDRRIQDLQEDGGLRAQLLNLHGMLHTVMDGAQVTVPADQALVDLANDVADEIREFKDMFSRWAELLSKVTELGSASADGR